VVTAVSIYDGVLLLVFNINFNIM